MYKIAHVVELSFAMSGISKRRQRIELIHDETAKKDRAVSH